MRSWARAGERMGSIWMKRSWLTALGNVVSGKRELERVWWMRWGLVRDMWGSKKICTVFNTLLEVLL